MSERPEIHPGSDLVLLRRARPEAFQKSTGFVKGIAFNLRPNQNERELSLYDAASVDPQSLLISGAVSFEGWGVAALELKHLTEFGFVVVRSPDEDDPVNGQFHYLARPSELDANNQIPLSVRDVLASKAIWLIRPIRS